MEGTRTRTSTTPAGAVHSAPRNPASVGPHEPALGLRQRRQLDRRGVHRAQAHLPPGEALVDERRQAHDQRRRRPRRPAGRCRRRSLRGWRRGRRRPAPPRRRPGRRPRWRASRGSTAVTLTANRTAAAPASAGLGVEAEGHQQKPAGQPLKRPGAELGDGGHGGRGAGRRNTRRPSRRRSSERRSADQQRLQPPRARHRRGRDQHRREQHRQQHRERGERDSSSRPRRGGRATLTLDRLIAAPRMASASRFRSVWETIVPEHHRQRLARPPEPPRDDQRARGLAQAGGQRRGHQHADEGPLHRVAAFGRAARSARRRRIECQASARTNIAAHMRPRPAATRPGLEATQRGRDAGRRRPAAAPARRGPAGERARHERRAAQRAQAPRRGAGRRAGRLQARQALGGDPRQQVGGRKAVADGQRGPARVAGAPIAQRLLVAVEHFGGHVRPGEALGALAAPSGHAPAQARSSASRAQRLGQRERVAGGPRAGRRGRRARRRGSRGCPRRARASPAANASVRTMPKLSPPSEGAHSTSARGELLRACAARRPCRARARRGRRASCGRPPPAPRRRA